MVIFFLEFTDLNVCQTLNKRRWFITQRNKYFQLCISLKTCTPKLISKSPIIRIAALVLCDPKAALAGHKHLLDSPDVGASWNLAKSSNQFELLESLLQRASLRRCSILIRSNYVASSSFTLQLTLMYRPLNFRDQLAI